VETTTSGDNPSSIKSGRTKKAQTPHVRKVWAFGYSFLCKLIMLSFIKQYNNIMKNK